MKTYEMTIAMKQIEEAWPNPGPDEEEKCRRLFTQNNAQDLLPMLGLES